MPCHGIDGCFRGDEVNIGYRPHRAVRPTAIRVGRGPRHAAVVALDAGQGVARQTERNPRYDDLPPDRAPESGEDRREWIWVYGRRDGGSGSVPLDDVAELRCNGPRGCAGVTVIAAQSVRAGASGWVAAAALARSGAATGAPATGAR